MAVSYRCGQTSAATVISVLERLKTIFTKKSESTVSTAVRHRTAGGTLSKLATVAAILIMTGTMNGIVMITTAATKPSHCHRD